MGNSKKPKVCKFCKAEIPANSKTCPSCHKKRGKGCLIPLIILGSFVLLIIIVAIAVGDSNAVDETFNPSMGEKADDLSIIKNELKEKYDITEPGKFLKGDSTGKWRIVKVANATPPADYALDYAKVYMQEATMTDIHYIVNFSLKTTTKLQVILGKLSVITTEYVDKEEQDASLIGRGMVYSEQYFDLETESEIKAEQNPQAEAITPDSFIAAVKQAIAGTIGKDEIISDVALNGKNLIITIDMTNADTSIFPAKDIAESRISSITDSILALDDSCYASWETITLDFGNVGKATLDKTMVKDQGFGKFFDFPLDILE